MSAPKPLRALYGSRERLQEILTPPGLLDTIEKVWPIALDPCGSALHKFAPTTLLQGGLGGGWVDGTYANPPYKDLHAWIIVADMEARAGTREIMMLAPARPHRTWFWPEEATAIAWLKPVAFVGFKSAFPAPLVMFYWGQALDAFEEAFRAISTRVEFL